MKVLEAAEQYVSFGQVRYLTYQTEILGTDDALIPFFRKRRSYEHEREVRALILPPNVHDLRSLVELSDATRREVRPAIDDGIYMPIDPHSLIEAIYCAPGSGNWYLETVRAAVDALEFTGPVHRSALDGVAGY